jgi:hypothetical protein
MGELSWQDLGESKASSWEWTWHHTIGAVLIVCTVLSTAVLVLPIRDLLSSPATLALKYTRTPAWLNRCDEACARTLHVAYLDGQQHCSALTQLWQEENHADVLAWRLAIDDRASFLGCPGFPRSLADMRAGVVNDAQDRRDQEESVRFQREQESLDAAVQTVQRYERSLSEGDLSQYVERSAQDPIDRNMLFVTVTTPWLELPRDQRLRITETLWQKWAIISTPADPWESSVMFVNSEGALLGEAPSGSENVWLAE